MKFVVVFFVVLCVYHARAECPPEGFDSVAPFDPLKYISRSWYVQEQRPVSYQPESSLFCVTATYELRNSSDITDGIQVLNYANNGTVNGPATTTAINSTTSIPLIAFIPDLSDPSKLRVGPSFLETIYGEDAVSFFGDYWVVAVGPNHPYKDYEWAIISVGAPTIETPFGCQTGGNSTNAAFQSDDAGLWLFSRTPVDPWGTWLMRKKAALLGFDLTVLRKVEQRDCSYEGATLK